MSLQVPAAANLGGRSAPHGEDKCPRRKRGRPRNDTDNPTEPPEERRRKQIRLAQRAHRQREKEALSRHEVRIAQLETSIQKMNMAFSSFSEQLEKSGALAPHATLQAHLRDTLTTYKSLAEEVGITTDYECLHRSSQSMVAVPVQEENVRSTPDSWLLSELDRLLTPPMAPISIQNPPAPLGPSSPLLFNTTMTTMSLPTVEMSVFIRQLRVACAHYALFSLRDSSVDLEGLRSKFRFLLSIISRENLISYFEAGVVARVHPERMLEWEELPFFRVGGAGTHFVNSPSLRYENRHPVRDDPLSSFPPEVQGEMDGRWYDIRDLEGFLQEQGVRLFTSLPTESGRIPSNVAAVNVSTLIKGLVRTSICLGRSPGWRPVDVENAIRMSLWEKEENVRHGLFDTEFYEQPLALNTVCLYE